MLVSCVLRVIHSTVGLELIEGEGVGLYISDGLHISSVVRDYSAGTSVESLWVE